jgi:hypothetical protein
MSTRVVPEGVALLPPEFADFEPFARDWALPTATERYDRRLAGTMAEMQAFYDVVVPRTEEAIQYLDQFDLYDMPDTALHLMWLLGAVSVVSFAVDIFHQPKIPDSGVGYIPITVEPVP